MNAAEMTAAVGQHATMLSPGEIAAAIGFAVTVGAALIAGLAKIFSLGGDVRTALNDIVTLKAEAATVVEVRAVRELAQSIADARAAATPVYDKWIESIETRMNVAEGAVNLLQALEKDRKDALREMRADIDKRFDKLETKLDAMQTTLATKT